MTSLAAYSCGELQSGGEASFEASAQAVASAMAESVASVLTTCKAQGDTSGGASGVAQAFSRAEADGKATVDILATAEVCGQCKASLDFFTEVVRTVGVTAVAEAEAEVCSNAGLTLATPIASQSCELWPTYDQYVADRDR